MPESSPFEAQPPENPDAGPGVVPAAAEPSSQPDGVGLLVASAVLMLCAAAAATLSALIRRDHLPPELRDLHGFDHPGALLISACSAAAVFLLTRFSAIAILGPEASSTAKNRAATIAVSLFLVGHVCMRLPSLMFDVELVGSVLDAMETYGTVALVASILRAMVIVGLGVMLSTTLIARRSCRPGVETSLVYFVIVPIMAIASVCPTASMIANVWLSSVNYTETALAPDFYFAYGGWDLASLMRIPTYWQSAVFSVLAVVILTRALALVRSEARRRGRSDDGGASLSVQLRAMRTLVIVGAWSLSIAIGAILVFNGFWLLVQFNRSFAGRIFLFNDIIMPIELVSQLVTWVVFIILFHRMWSPEQRRPGFGHTICLTIVTIAATFTIARWTVEVLPMIGLTMWTAIFRDVTGTILMLPAASFIAIAVRFAFKILVTIILVRLVVRWFQDKVGARVQGRWVVASVAFLSFMVLAERVLLHVMMTLSANSNRFTGPPPIPTWMETSRHVSIGTGMVARALLIVAIILMVRQMLGVLAHARGDRCLACGYDLQHSKAARCPECGTDRLQKEVAEQLTQPVGDLPRDDVRVVSLLTQLHSGALAALAACILAGVGALIQVLILIRNSAGLDTLSTVWWVSSRIVEIAATIPVVFLIILFSRLFLASRTSVGEYRYRQRGLSWTLLLVFIVSFICFMVPEILEHVVDLSAISYDFYLKEINPLARALSASAVVVMLCLAMMYFLVMSLVSSLLRNQYGYEHRLVGLHVVAIIFGAVLLAHMIARSGTISDLMLMNAMFDMALEPERRGAECIVFFTFGWWCWSLRRFARRARSSVEAGTGSGESKPGSASGPTA